MTWFQGNLSSNQMVFGRNTRHQEFATEIDVLWFVVLPDTFFLGVKTTSQFASTSSYTTDEFLSNIVALALREGVWSAQPCDNFYILHVPWREIRH